MMHLNNSCSLLHAVCRHQSTFPLLSTYGVKRRESSISPSWWITAADNFALISVHISGVSIVLDVLGFVRALRHSNSFCSLSSRRLWWYYPEPRGVLGNQNLCIQVDLRVLWKTCRFHQVASSQEALGDNFIVLLFFFLYRRLNPGLCAS